jgi:hypothetical protein
MIRARLAALTAALALCGTVTAYADPVTDWNLIAVTAASQTITGRPGPPGLLDLALVHAAVHDAVQAIEGRFERYRYAGSGAGSLTAAVAAAAHRVLVELYPAQKDSLDAQYVAYVGIRGLTQDAGVAVGEAAAAALYPAHYRSPTPIGFPTEPEFGRLGVGEWNSPVAMGLLHLAFSKPFTLNRIDQFRPPPPPPIGSVTYARDYAEVQAIGDKSKHPDPSVLGTATDLAWFWSGNYPVQWNETARQLADAYGASIGDNARLFALINLAAADAAMAVWDSKLFYNFWRPQPAVRELVDGNSRTTPDDKWTSLLASPPYPDYVSGANGLTGAFTGMFRNFFGTDVMSFTVTTGAANAKDKERDFDSFSEAAQEVVEARILLGIHFRFADEEARRLGERVAHWTFQKYLRPVGGSQ